MNVIYIVTLNFNFNTDKTEIAFTNRAKAKSFFIGCVIDAQDSGYKKDELNFKAPSSVVEHVKFSKPSNVDDSIDTQHITMKRISLSE
jgi:hypothetical protein